MTSKVDRIRERAQRQASREVPRPTGLGEVPVTKARVTADLPTRRVEEIEALGREVRKARGLHRVNRMEVLATLIEAALDDPELRRRVIEAVPAPRKRGAVD